MSNSMTSRVEAILQRILGMSVELGIPRSRVEVLLFGLLGEISELSKATIWLGTTTTPLSEGATTNPIIVDGEEVTAKEGAIVSYLGHEFIFDGEEWQGLGGGGGEPIDTSDFVRKSELATEPGDATDNAMSQAAVTMAIGDIQSMIDALEDRVEILENAAGESDIEIDSDGYMLIDEDGIDEDGYLVTSVETDDSYLVVNSGGGDISYLDIVVTSGTLNLTGENATIRDGKLIFDTSISGILNFESSGGGGDDGDYEIIEDELVINSGADIDNGYLVMVGEVIDDYYNI